MLPIFFEKLYCFDYLLRVLKVSNDKLFTYCYSLKKLQLICTVLQPFLANMV